MPDPEPPDLPSFLKSQRDLNEAMLQIIRRVESRLPSAPPSDDVILSAAMLPLDPVAESPTNAKGSRASYRFFYILLAALAVLAGLLVIKPPPAPSMEEQHLRQELMTQKTAYETRISTLNAALKGNQEALIRTQEALGDVQKELIRTQAALRDARQPPPSK